MNLPDLIPAAQAAGAGTLCAVAARLVPELMKFADRRCAERHEAIMFDKNIALHAQQSQERLAVLQAQAEAEGAQLASALHHAALPRRTGIRWLDALNSS